MFKILITGFEPFGDDTINPALEAAKRLEGYPLKGGEIVTCSVPVVKQKSISMVLSAIEQHKPNAVMTIGQASGRYGITPERVAINLDDFRIPDNEGHQPIDMPIIEGAPLAYLSTLPIKAMVKAMQAQGIPAQVSNTAGTFVCNHLFYGVQHHLVSTNIRHGFIHIPLLPEQAVSSEQPTMSLDNIVLGLSIAAQAVIDNEQDIQMAGGQLN